MDFEDEPDFEPVTKKDAQKESIKRSKTENNNVSRTNRRSNSEVKSTRHYTSVDRSPMYHKKEEKTFHPTPIISPIYGILNKNYEKDDVTEKRSLRPNTEDDVEVPTITRTKKEKKKTQKSLNLDIDNDEENDSKILDDTKEQDLFKLIDNMYSDEEEEEEDE